jgi:hypothetical protein
MNLLKPWFFLPFSLLLALLFSFQPKEKPKYTVQKLADLVNVKIPETFQKLSEDQIADKIITPRKPLAMFSSMNGHADFSFSVGNSARNPWEDKDLKMMAQFQKSNIKSMFTSVEFIQEKIVKVHGQQYALFEIISEVKEKGKPPIRKYSQIRYTIRKKNLFVFNFTCNEAERPLFEEIAIEILDSVKF